MHLHSNGSMLGAWYWFHHNIDAAPGNSVGCKYYVGVVPSPPSTAVETAGKLGIVNQAQCLIEKRSPVVGIMNRRRATMTNVSDPMAGIMSTH